MEQFSVFDLQIYCNPFIKCGGGQKKIVEEMQNILWHESGETKRQQILAQNIGLQSVS